MNISEASRTLDLLAVLKVFAPGLPEQTHRDALFLAERARKALDAGGEHVHFWQGLVDAADTAQGVSR